MAVRKRLNHDLKTRERIQTTQLVKRLKDHVDGIVELSSTQVRAAEILLKKTLPDLQSVEMVSDVTVRNANELTDQELANIAAGSSTGTAEPENSETQIH